MVLAVEDRLVQSNQVYECNPAAEDDATRPSNRSSSAAAITPTFTVQFVVVIPISAYTFALDSRHLKMQAGESMECPVLLFLIRFI